MIRISKAFFALGTVFGLAVLPFACSQGSLSGGSGLTPGKSKDKKKDKASEEEPKDTDTPPEEGGDSESGTDVPVWVNASYLTCDLDSENSTEDDVAVVCGLDDKEGDPIKPDDSEREWVVLDENGDEQSDKGEATSSKKRMEARFLIKGKKLAQSGAGVKFNGQPLAKGKTVQMKVALPALKEDGEDGLAACLEAADADAKSCVAQEAGKDEEAAPMTTRVRIFILSSLNTADLGGVAGANAKCQAGAQAGSLTGKYQALISTEAQDARDLVKKGLPIYGAAAGGQIAVDADALFAGDFVNPVVHSENGGKLVSRPVWTGSSGNGTAAGDNCENWGTSSTDEKGMAGLTGSTGNGWLATSDEARCAIPSHLYCIEVE